MVDDASRVALHFFCLRTLPILRVCQPSSLWGNVITSLLQEDDSIQDIAVAIGFAQRLQTHTSADAITDLVQKQALLAYDKALHSLRLSIDSKTAKDPLIHIFACLMMILLESLRGFHLGLLVHLRSGLRIAAANDQTNDSAEVKGEIVDLLQRFRVSSSFFGLFAARNATLTELTTQEHYLLSSHRPRSHEAPVSALENYAVIGSSVQLWHSLFEATTATQRDRLRSAIPTLRAQNADLRASWPSEGHYQTEKQPLRGFTEAQQRLTDLALHAATAVPDVDEVEDSSFTEVLDLLESSLKELRVLRGCNGDEPVPFSAGIGVIGALCLVALQCQDSNIRDRALNLMELCPRREGLWDAQEVQRVLKASRLDASQSSGSHRLIQSMHKMLPIL